MPPSTLTASDVAPLVARLEGGRRRLRRRSERDRIDLLGRVAATWLDDGLTDAAAEVARTTGYAPAMVEACLERTLRAWNAGALHDLVRRATAAPGSVATPPDLVVAVLAQNTPGLAIAPAFTALALGSAVVLKSSRGEPSFASALIERLAAVDPALAEAAAAVVWPGGDPIETDLFAHASRVVVYGAQDAIDRARTLAGERVLAFGPRVSVAVVGPRARVAETAAALARDVAFLDQRGCLSPQFVLVHDAIDRAALARALAGELRSVESEWPRRALDASAAKEFRTAVEDAEARSLAGTGAELFGGVRDPWAVVVEPGPAILPSPLDRFVRLHPFRDEETLRTSLEPIRGQLESIGVSGGRDEIVDVARALGAARVCAIGEMQDPPADWHAGGQRPMAAYLSWSNPFLGEVGDGSDRRARFLAHVAQTSDAPRGIDVDRAQGSWVVDRSGRRHLDLLAGIGVAAIGHAHPHVAAAVARQATQYTHVMVYGEDVLAPQVDLAARLASKLPSHLSMTYFTNSGAEAIEGALKLVRKATGRKRVLAFEGSYHGDTTGAMALGGNAFYREPFRPLVEPVEHLPWNDRSALARIDDATAAVFAEPVQAEGGVRIPSPDFLPRLAARCREVGALLVFDEVVTGLGRTGRWFGFEHWPGSEPDVLVLAKSLGGGLPLGAFVSSPGLLRALSEDPPLGHVTTFGGNPVCCAAALASLDVLESEGLPDRAARVGDRFRERLSALAGRRIVDVRGLGMLIGIELESPERTIAFVDACRRAGVLLGWTLHHDRVVRLAPPLTLEDGEMETALRVIERALSSSP